MFRRSYSSILLSSSVTAATTTVAPITSSSPPPPLAPSKTTNEQIYQVRRSVVPLQERFGGVGLGRPETPSQMRAQPLDFNVMRNGTTLRITWKIHSLAPKTSGGVDGGGGGSSKAANIEGAAATAEPKTARAPCVNDGETVTTQITAELMRVCAPSTDVLSLPQSVAVSGKRGLTFTDLTLVGNYAVRVSFSDGHTAGIFGYQYLFDLSGPEKWLRSRMYLETLRGCRRSRSPIKKRDGSSTIHAEQKDPMKEAVLKAEERERREKAGLAEPPKKLPNAAEMGRKAALAEAAAKRKT